MTAPPTDKMLSRIEGGIGWMTFNNPERHNAISYEMRLAILTILDTFEKDPGVRVIVMRGAGEKAFVSGSDISQFDKNRDTAEQQAEYDRVSAEVQKRYASLSKPLIAMIHGYCLGGGLGMALNADLRFASPDSQFSVPAAIRGIAYAPDGLKQLVDLVGPAIAKDIMFSARRLNADEALRIGLINRIVDADQLEAETIAYAETLAANAPLSLRASKFFINQLGLECAERDEARMEAMQREAEASEDFKEATRSFVEKRKPVFHGR